MSAVRPGDDERAWLYRVMFACVIGGREFVKGDELIYSEPPPPDEERWLELVEVGKISQFAAPDR